HGGLRRFCLRDGREPSAGLFKLDSSNNDKIKWSVEAPKLGDAAIAAGVRPEDIAALDALNPEPSSVRDVKARMRWNSVRASDALREWRSRRSQGVPEEQGTADSSVPRSPPLCVGNGERLPVEKTPVASVATVASKSADATHATDATPLFEGTN